jgi:hypothetical protein
MKSFYRAAQTAVSLARLFSAAFYLTIAILLIGFALWLALPLGQGWLFNVLAIFFGLHGAAVGVEGVEIFLNTRPPERPPQQQRLPASPGYRNQAAPRDRR